MQTALIVAILLLLFGVFLRARIKLLQILYIPASIVGGLIGLLAGPSFIGILSDDVISELNSWPGWLIALIFAGLFLDSGGRSIKQSIRGALRQGVMVWLIVFGQSAIGITVTWLILKNYYDIPYSFGQLVEAGFAGGHGAAAAFSEVYSTLGFESGGDIAFFVATMGLIYGVVSGIILVNIGVRKGWNRGGKDIEIPKLTGFESRNDPQPIMVGKIRNEVLDPLAFQILILGVAFAGGVGLYYLLNMWFPFLERLPLFIFTLISGFVLRELMKMLRIGDLIDGSGIRRITGTAMEFLIVSAIASLNLVTVVEMIVPVSVLLGIGFLYVIFCLVYLAPRILPKDYWFELGLINYGMSTGTTATGLMLLRIVDKDFETPAAAEYALAAPLSAPFIGGGIITFTLPFLMEEVSLVPIVAVMISVLVGLYVIGRMVAKRESERKENLG